MSRSLPIRKGLEDQGCSSVGWVWLRIHLIPGSQEGKRGLRMWIWALAPLCFSIVLLCSGETGTWRPLDLGLPDCGTEANELVLFKKLPRLGNSAREAGNWTKWAKGSLCSPLQDYQGFPVPSLIEWESREAWPLAGKGFLTRKLAIITFPPHYFYMQLIFREIISEILPELA